MKWFLGVRVWVLISFTDRTYYLFYFENNVIFSKFLRTSQQFTFFLQIITFFYKQYYFSVKFINSRFGNVLALYKDYTFSYMKHVLTKGTSHWRCSTHHSKGCRARLTLNSANALMYGNLDHTHSPYKYYIHNNKFVKVD